MQPGGPLALMANWNTSANWISATVPGPMGIATFTGVSSDVDSMDGGVDVGTLNFTAPNYTFDVPDEHIINGQGIIARLANAATFNIMSTVGATPGWAFDFNGTSSAGTAHFVLGQVVDTAGGFNAGFINFQGSSTAGQARLQRGMHRPPIFLIRATLARRRSLSRTAGSLVSTTRAAALKRLSSPTLVAKSGFLA